MTLDKWHSSANSSFENIIFSSPVLTEKSKSPSYGKWDGTMALERPSCAHVATRFASDFVIVALVATMPIVELAPSFIELILLYLSAEP